MIMSRLEACCLSLAGLHSESLSITEAACLLTWLNERTVPCESPTRVSLQLPNVQPVSLPQDPLTQQDYVYWEHHM